MPAKYVVSEVIPPLVRGDFVKLHLCPSPSETRRRLRLSEKSGRAVDRPSCEPVWVEITGEPSSRSRTPCYMGKPAHKTISIDIGREPVRFCTKNILEYLTAEEARTQAKKPQKKGKR